MTFRRWPATTAARSRVAPQKQKSRDGDRMILSAGVLFDGDS